MNICVTGASKGLGRALCQVLTESEHTVWGVARSEMDLRETEKLCAHGLFHWSEVDITQEDSVRSWEQKMKHKEFSPDVIILNASLQMDDMADGFDLKKGTQTIRTNIEGNFACVSMFLPAFLKRSSGTFILIASTAALRPSVRSAAYSASKAAMAMAFRSFRMRYAKDGIVFKTVMLGPIRSDMWEGRDSFLVASSQSAAQAIVRFLASRSSALYYPRISTFLLRFSLFLPDRFFAAVSSTFLK